MREKIARLLYGFDNLGPSPLGEHERKVYRAKVDKVLTLISEEIEKVENPFAVPERGKLIMLDLEKHQRDGFEDCRQKILALFRSK